MPLLEKLDILAELPDDASRARLLKALQAHFDPDFYLETYPDVREAGLDPLEHYLRAGWKENRNPSPDFSTRSYLEANPDVVETGDNPFLYHVWTQAEAALLPEDEDLAAAAMLEIAPPVQAAPVDPPAQGTEAVAEKPQSDDDAENPLLEEMDRLRAVFDTDFYVRKNPEITESWPDPLEHFVRFGWKEGRDPSSDFSVSYYLSANPDVASSGRNPFFHYVVDGRREGRAGFPDEPKTAREDTPESAADKAIMAEMEQVREMFDAAFYLSKNPGVTAAGLDLLEHFVRFGWKEGRDPHPDFSVRYYLAANPDVAATGRNPFLHYVTNGRQEGRVGKAEE